MKRYIYILGFLILLFSCDRRSVEDNQHIIHLTPVYETDNKRNRRLFINIKLYSVTNSESKERMRGRGTKNSNRLTKL